MQQQSQSLNCQSCLRWRNFLLLYTDCERSAFLVAQGCSPNKTAYNADIEYIHMCVYIIYMYIRQRKLCTQSKYSLGNCTIIVECARTSTFSLSISFPFLSSLLENNFVPHVYWNFTILATHIALSKHKQRHERIHAYIFYILYLALFTMQCHLVGWQFYFPIACKMR